MFIPFIVLYIILVHFTGQYYENLLLLILFFFIFTYLDLAVGSFIEIFLEAVTDVYTNIFVNKIIHFLLECAGSYIVLSGLDYFFDGIHLTVLIKMVIALFHTGSSLLIERYKSDEDEDMIITEHDNVSPAIINEMTIHLQQHENWIECVDYFTEKYPEIPKSKIIATTRKLHMRNKKSP